MFYFLFFFFFNDTATTEIYTLSLHDALPIAHDRKAACRAAAAAAGWRVGSPPPATPATGCAARPGSRRHCPQARETRPASPGPLHREIGRASCRERV